VRRHGNLTAACAAARRGSDFEALAHAGPSVEGVAALMGNPRRPTQVARRLLSHPDRDAVAIAVAFDLLDDTLRSSQLEAARRLLWREAARGGLEAALPAARTAYRKVFPDGPFDDVRALAAAPAAVAFAHGELGALAQLTLTLCADDRGLWKALLTLLPTFVGTTGELTATVRAVAL
jgi:hypothetical protein